MQKLLHLLPWQLFALVIGIPFLLQFVFTGLLIANPNPAMVFIAMPIVLLCCAGVLFGWMYAIATYLHPKLPPTVTMNLTRFKFFLFSPIVYLALIFGILFRVFSNVETESEPDFAVFLVIFPLHLFSMFCFIYCLYYNAKTLKAVELQKPVTFSDFAGEFALLWVFPIGIWVIQPRLNKLFDPNLN